MWEFPSLRINISIICRLCGSSHRRSCCLVVYGSSRWTKTFLLSTGISFFLHDSAWKGNKLSDIKWPLTVSPTVPLSAMQWGPNRVCWCPVFSFWVSLSDDHGSVCPSYHRNVQCIKQVKERQSPIATCLSSIKSCVWLDSDSQILILYFPNAVQSVRKPVPLEDAPLVEPMAGRSYLFVHGFTLPYSIRGSTAGKHACTVCCEVVQYIFPTLVSLKKLYRSKISG